MRSLGSSLATTLGLSRNSLNASSDLSPSKKHLQAWSDGFGLNNSGSQANSLHNTPGRNSTPPGTRRRHGVSAITKEDSLSDTNGELRNLLGRSWSSPGPLSNRAENQALRGSPPSTPSGSEKRRRNVYTSNFNGMESLPMAPLSMPAAHTTNGIYGMRQVEADPPSSAADKGRKLKTCSSVVMGM